MFGRISDRVEARNGINRGRKIVRYAQSSIPRIIFSERVGINERIKMRIPASSIRVCLWIKRVERASDLVRERERKREKVGAKVDERRDTWLVGRERKRGEYAEACGYRV